MYKSLFVVCVVLCVVIEARPKWQFLPPMPGYIPVYIRNGDTPLEEINPDLAEAFHALPSGRSALKDLEASPDLPELPEQPEVQEQPHVPDEPEVLQQPEAPTVPQPEEPPKPKESFAVDRRPYEKKLFERKLKKVFEITAKPDVERS